MLYGRAGSVEKISDQFPPGSGVLLRLCRAADIGHSGESTVSGDANPGASGLQIPAGENERL